MYCSIIGTLAVCKAEHISYNYVGKIFYVSELSDYFCCD